ncbi:MAG TPA: hypothetical protein VGR07_12945, partial [Thermoanaerobaculia bacterium]|nr:hypothetical protein [Thermoanaerobaculia bacterium]
MKEATLKAFRRRLSLYLAALGCVWAGAGAPARMGAAPGALPPASPKAIKILSDAVLPVPAYLRASDVRWAG